VTAPGILAAVLLAATAVHAQRLRPLHKDSCELPETLKGVSAHILVKFNVNLAGKVSSVEVAYSTVDPPGQAEPVERRVTSCVEGWTFEPHPDPSTWGHGSVEVFQGFHYFRPPPANAETVEIYDGHRVPRANLEEMRSAKLDFGAALLKGPGYFEVSGEGWSLRSNMKKKGRTVFIDAIHDGMAAFDRIFPTAPPVPEGADLTIMLFRSQDEFNRIAAFDNVFRGPQPAGEYNPRQRTAYTFGSSQSYNHPQRLAVEALVHEVTHHLVFQRLAGGDRTPPYWVNEGIASFIQLLKPPHKGELDLTRFVRGRQVQGAFRWMASSSEYLEAYTRRKKEGSLPDLESFLEGKFESLDADTAYGLSWILVHYLINGEEGRLAEPFTRWMLGTMGSGKDPGLAAALGLSVEELGRRLDGHVEVMKRSG